MSTRPSFAKIGVATFAFAFATLSHAQEDDTSRSMSSAALASMQPELPLGGAAATLSNGSSGAVLAALGADQLAELNDDELASERAGRTWFGTLTDNHYRVASWGVVVFLAQQAAETFIPFIQVADNDKPWNLKAIDTLVCKGVPTVATGLYYAQQLRAGTADNRELDYADAAAGIGVGLGFSVFQYGCQYATYQIAHELAKDTHDGRRRLLATTAHPAIVADDLRELNLRGKWAIDQAMIAGNRAAQLRDQQESALATYSSLVCQWSQGCRAYYLNLVATLGKNMNGAKARFADMAAEGGQAALQYMSRLGVGWSYRSQLAGYARENFTYSRKVMFQIANDQ